MRDILVYEPEFHPSDATVVAMETERLTPMRFRCMVLQVTAINSTSWPIYLPQVAPTHEWVYFWNLTSMGSPQQHSEATSSEGTWVNIDTTAIADFPLFYRRPLTKCASCATASLGAHGSVDELLAAVTTMPTAAKGFE